MTSKNEARRLVFDIERMKGSFRKQHRGLTVEGEFWSLSDYKRTFGYIYPDEVTEWPRTICVAWRFIGDRKVEFASEWADGQLRMHRQIWEAVDEADILIGHNIVDFDIKHLNTAWRDLGFTPPSPYRVVDTLKGARSAFGDESKTLDALNKRSGVSAKTDRYDVEVARAALAGDIKAQKKLERYNKGDIKASEARYLNQLAWTKHPSVGLYSEPGFERLDVCQTCGSENIHWRGYRTTQIGKYPRFQCQDCGTWGKGKKAIAFVNTRAA